LLAKPIMMIPFTKMHGIGNDYVYIDAFHHNVPDPVSLARQVSPRHTGIGSDGLILIRPSDRADCRMEMYNADGSRGVMCGNGIRCVAKYAYEHDLAPVNPMQIDTDAGVKMVDLALRDGRVVGATVDMGAPILDGPRIPVAAEGRVIGAPLEIAGTSYAVTCVSMGNPHCVVFTDDVEAVELQTIGPLFEHHPFFPEQVNTEFVRIDTPDSLTMRVWERGSGETAACGTGACAALVAAVLNDRSARRATVRLRGGDLQIEWLADDRVMMTGGATEVFHGEIEVAQ
jgi:diaminopimelate epimerase